MANTIQKFIKKDNMYAVAYFHNMPMPILSLAHYLIDEKKINSPIIINTFEQAISLCKREKNAYFFNFIHLQLSKTPTEQKNYSIDEIEQSYQTILAFHALYKVLLKEVNKHYILISKLKNHQLHNYFNFDAILEYAKQYHWRFGKKLNDFDNVLFTEIAYHCFDKIFSDEIKSILNIWKKVVSKEGKILQIEETDVDIPFYKETVYLAYASLDNNQHGYVAGWNQVGKLSEARFYQSLDTVRKQRHAKNAAIVEASIIFKKFVEKDNNVDTSLLDGFIAKEEKEHLEQQDTKLSLAQKLLEYVKDNEVLKAELEKIIQGKTQSSETALKRNKI